MRYEMHGDELAVFFSPQEIADAVDYEGAVEESIRVADENDEPISLDFQQSDRGLHPKIEAILKRRSLERRAANEQGGAVAFERLVQEHEAISGDVTELILHAVARIGAGSLLA